MKTRFTTILCATTLAVALSQPSWSEPTQEVAPTQQTEKPASTINLLEWRVPLKRDFQNYYLNTSQESYPISDLTLKQTLEIALQRSPEVEEVLAKLEQSKAQVRQVEAGYRPKLDAIANLRYSSPKVSFSLSPGNEVVIAPHYTYNLGLTLNQAIATFGRSKWQLQASKLAAQGKVFEVMSVLDQKVLKVALTYFNVLEMQEQVAIQESFVKANEENLRVSQLLFENGMVAKFDVYSNQSNLEKARQQLLVSQNNHAKTIASLKRELMLPLHSQLSLNPDQTLVHTPDQPLEKYAEEALATRPERIALRQNILASVARVRAERSGKNPTLGLSAGWNHQSATGLSPNNETWNAVLALQVPLFDSGMTKAKVSQAQAVYQELLAIEAKLSQQILSQVESAYLDLQTAQESMVMAQAQLRESQEAIRIARLRYKEGLSTNVELLQAEAGYVAANSTVVNTKYAQKKAYLNWLFSTGQLRPYWSDRLKQSSDRLPIEFIQGEEDVL